MWRRARLRAILPYVLATAALVTGLVVVGDEVARHIAGFEAWIAGLGVWGPVVFLVLYPVLGSVFVPDIVLGIAAGVSFGVPRGLVLVVGGSLAGATLQYVLARRLLRSVIDRYVSTKPALAAIRTAVRHDELRLQLLIRLTPLNRALTSYLLGASGVAFRGFVGACVALLPSLGLEVYFGYAGKHLATMTGAPGHAVAVHDIVLGVGLVLAIAVVAAISRAARRTLEAAAAAVPAAL